MSTFLIQNGHLPTSKWPPAYLRIATFLPQNCHLPTSEWPPSYFRIATFLPQNCHLPPSELPPFYLRMTTFLSSLKEFLLTEKRVRGCPMSMLTIEEVGGGELRYSPETENHRKVCVCRRSSVVPIY